MRAMAHNVSAFLLALILLPVNIWAQAAAPATSGVSSAQKPSSQRAVSLAEGGRCKEAMPLLRIAAQQRSDREAQRKAGVLGVRCALSLDQRGAAGEFLAILNREFRNDPEVLYVSIHAYSDLSTRAAMDLAQVAPSSYQALELNAESLEMQGQWDEAAKVYQTILKQFPTVSGVHYHLARVYLSKPNPEAGSEENARKELQMEVELDPQNAGAEYLLGEMAREGGKWDEAIEHLSRATKLDPSFPDAFLGLGMSCVSAGKAAEAIPPLEAFEKMQPANPAGHYHLAVAYNRAGRKEDAKREAELQKATQEKIDQQKQVTPDAAQKPSTGPEAQQPEPHR